MTVIARGEGKIGETFQFRLMEGLSLCHFIYDAYVALHYLHTLCENQRSLRGLVA